MEMQLSYKLKLSLQQMALRRIAAALYNDLSILASFANFQSTRDLWSKWRETVKCMVTRKVSELPLTETLTQEMSYTVHSNERTVVKDKITKLQLPKSLKKQMLPILEAVALEILKWKMIHEAYLRDSSDDFKVHVLAKLRWTPAGTVDYRETAKELVSCDVVDIVTRFELACLYCLENYIPLLWEELPEENRNSFYNEEVTSRVETPHLQLFLPYILEKSKIDTRNLTLSNSFEKAALCGNKTLAEYCYLKLTEEEKKASLIQTAKHVIECRDDAFSPYFDSRKEKLSDVFCYLLSLMTPEEQMGIFKELPCQVLRCFLDWPWQDLFLDNAGVIWTFLPESRYDDLAYTIAKSVRYSGYYVPNIFRDFFMRSPIQFKKRFFQQELMLYGNLFWNFFNNEDTDTIEVIFRNVDAEDRRRLVFCECGLGVIYTFHEKWDVLEVFLREATLSEEDKERLKGAFIEFMRIQEPKYKNSTKAIRRKYKKFFEFV